MNTLIDEIGHQLYLYRVKCDIALSDRDEGIISQEEYAQAIERQKEINTNAIKSELLKAILASKPEKKNGCKNLHSDVLPSSICSSGGCLVNSQHNETLDQWEEAIKELFK